MFYQINDYVLTIQASDKGITRIDIDLSNKSVLNNSMTVTNLHIKQCLNELDEYFLGQRQVFTVALDINSGTKFQQDVWQELTNVPYGSTMFYQEIAEQINRPKACQAIGQANKKNPIPILIPCHRIIGKNGKLTGYQGKSSAGLNFKQFLLTLEQKNRG